MANPVKGEVSFEAGGQQYTFVLGTYALAALQRRTGVGTSRFFGRKPNEGGTDDFLGVFYCGLLRHHQLSEEAVSDIMDEIGQVRVADIISDAISLAFPDPKGAAKSTDRPPKVVSTGTQS